MIGVRKRHKRSFKMSNARDNPRRRFLTGAATVVGGVGAAFAIWPFASAWQPSERAKAIGAPVDVDIAKLEPGARITVKWRGKPVWIVRRTQETIDALVTLDGQMRDPDSIVPQQPDYARNRYRSIKPEILVLVGLCTHLGCAPSHIKQGEGALGADWKGGFFCPCHGSRFDYAGRVYRGVPAPTNLEVPPHRYVGDTRIVIGQGQEETA